MLFPLWRTTDCPCMTHMVNLFTPKRKQQIQVVNITELVVFSFVNHVHDTSFLFRITQSIPAFTVSCDY